MGESSGFLFVLAGFFVIFFGCILGLLLLWKESYTVYEENRSFMITALTQLKGNWGGPVAVVAKIFGIYILLYVFDQFTPIFIQDLMPNVEINMQIIISATISLLLSSIIHGPLRRGCASYYLKFGRKENPPISELFSAFKTPSLFKNSIVSYLLIMIYVFLWSLLFVIPGIVAVYSYALTFYLLNDEPELTAAEAIAKSKKMMNGHKAQLFWLHCRFLGWNIVAGFTMMIGYLWLAPYMGMSSVNFYEKIRGEYEGVKEAPVIRK